ncbi:hypothetical protein GCK72_003135 [Caenorhabditis remanei]|uniref:Sdz-33 F-box domain-containing protein n=1 Tax=Caenorhabditis remanei TaxID=31234 RepID=A0A6A5HU88_CAERE|nr:hypothetical protein GCK72_003135 [Caenorhabditis remanei]KAF1771309.1 hypothetical protein GCK72_003135 [Caenorhabditis remanei]
MFQCKISISIISSYCYVSLLPTIFDLFNLQLEFKTLTIALNGSRDQKLLWNQISDKFGLAENLSITSVDNLGFKPVFASWPHNVDIPCSAWFTLEYLLACTCTKIKLGKSYFGNRDLDEILRKWKTG